MYRSAAPHPSVLAHKFLVAAVKRLPNRANLLLRSSTP